MPNDHRALLTAAGTSLDLLVLAAGCDVGGDSTDDAAIARLLKSPRRDLVFGDERLRCYLCVTVAPAAADDDALKRLLMDAECRATVGESSTGSAPPGPSRPGTAASTGRDGTLQSSHNTASYAASFWNGREAYTNNVARPLINGQGTCALIPLDLSPIHHGSTSPSADTVTLSVNLFVRERSHDAGHDSTFMQATSAQTADGALVRAAVATPLHLSRAFNALQMPSAVGISASRRATNQVIAHAPPMRRTVRRTLRVAPALTLRAHVSDARNHGRRDCIHLALELENGTTSPWIDVGVREVQVSAYGCIAKRVCFQGPSFDPSYDEAVLGETLRTGDELALLYRITTLDPLRAVDGNSDVHHATRTGSSWPDTVGSAVMVVAVDAMLVFRGAVSTNAVESRIPLACRWKCAMNADGVLEVRRAGTMEDEESSAARAMRQHQHRPSISSGMLSEEGLSIAVAVNGAGLGSSASENIAAHGVHLNRIFALHVEVVNRCRHSRKLAVCLLGGNIIGAGASLRERWSNKDKRVAMSAVGLLEVFDDHQRRDTSFISLETDVVLPQLDPGRSTMVHLHLIPIRGANTMQRIGILRCVDLETGAVVADMHDACEVFVRG